MTTIHVVPTAIAVCCREWIVPASGHYGRCGLCGTRPVLIQSLPPSQWIDLRKKDDPKWSKTAA